MEHNEHELDTLRRHMREDATKLNAIEKHKEQNIEKGFFQLLRIHSIMENNALQEWQKTAAEKKQDYSNMKKAAGELLQALHALDTLNRHSKDMVRILLLMIDDAEDLRQGERNSYGLHHARHRIRLFMTLLMEKFADYRLEQLEEV